MRRPGSYVCTRKRVWPDLLLHYAQSLTQKAFADSAAFLKSYYAHRPEIPVDWIKSFIPRTGTCTAIAERNHTRYFCTYSQMPNNTALRIACEEGKVLSGITGICGCTKGISGFTKPLLRSMVHGF